MDLMTDNQIKKCTLSGLSGFLPVHDFSKALIPKRILMVRITNSTIRVRRIKALSV